MAAQGAIFEVRLVCLPGMGYVLDRTTAYRSPCVHCRCLFGAFLAWRWFSPLPPPRHPYAPLGPVSVSTSEARVVVLPLTRPTLRHWRGDAPDLGMSAEDLLARLQELRVHKGLRVAPQGASYCVHLKVCPGWRFAPPAPLPPAYGAPFPTDGHGTVPPAGGVPPVVVN